jgi:hypothetical protein
MHGLVVGYILIEPIRVFDRAVLDACCTARALVLDDVARLFGQGDGKVAGVPCYTIDFSKG